jgi:stage IV sporulation protein A
MTTEPKFVPKEGIQIRFPNQETGRLRLIDCVGFLVPGAAGHEEDEKERMVKTPWSENEIPFSKAAAIGTEKVINEHANIGIVITTDGSFGEIPAEQFQSAEEKTIRACEKAGKPFVILLNTAAPASPQAESRKKQMEEKYGKPVLAINSKEMTREDVIAVMEQILADFPITRINFIMPKWIEFLTMDNWLKADLVEQCRAVIKKIKRMFDVTEETVSFDAPYIKEIFIRDKQLENGIVNLVLDFEESYYYEILSEMAGTTIEGEFDLISTLRELAGKKSEYEALASACEQVKGRGYGIVPPAENEITIADPELIRHGNKYGVKIKASCPSLHLIQANIETEIAPIVGSEEQAKDLIDYIGQNSRENPDGIFDTNIFGKTIRQLVDEGIHSKVNRLTEESQIKLQDTIQKVVNDSNGGLVCIII